MTNILFYEILTDGFSVVPASEVHPLTKKFYRWLSSEHFQCWHVEVVDEEDKKFAQRRSKHSFTTTIALQRASADGRGFLII